MIQELFFFLKFGKFSVPKYLNYNFYNACLFHILLVSFICYLYPKGLKSLFQEFFVLDIRKVMHL